MEYKHFSHPHTLTLYKVEAGQQQYQCHGCQLPCQGSNIFACWSCNFFLHEHCGNANRYVKHPSHPEHPLVLLPSPTYCSSSYLCNGCGAPGSSFSYCCPMCEVDVHVHCAYLPPNVTHKAHEHEVFLSFKLPDFNGVPVHCKICAKELNSKHWYYFCEKPECGFRIHTFCATNEVKPGLYGDSQPDDQAQVQVQIPVSCSQPQPPTAEDVLAHLLRLQIIEAQIANASNQSSLMNSL
ncbi:protein VACUOLELESS GAMETOPHYTES [Henckelia pumila]|uniref:protein VACUOLELESS GAMETOPHYTES n=1 Tax=Henckelia pumila TaxID=405737 RepID=UPI003C6E793E